MYLTDLAIRIRISKVSCGGKEICFHTNLISTKHCAHKKLIKKSILPSDRFARLFNSDLKILHMHALLTTIGWRKYSSTAAPRRAERSTPWKEGWYLRGQEDV